MGEVKRTIRGFEKKRDGSRTPLAGSTRTVLLNKLQPDRMY